MPLLRSYLILGYFSTNITLLTELFLLLIDISINITLLTEHYIFSEFFLPSFATLNKASKHYAPTELFLFLIDISSNISPLLGSIF